MAGVILGPERHRRWSDATKIKIFGETLMPGVKVSDVMARYNVSSSLVYTWRKQARLGLFGPMKQGAFAPVAIVESPLLTPSISQICDVVSPDFGLEDLIPVDTEQADPVQASTGERSYSDSMTMAGATMVVALPDGVRIMVGKDVDEAALGRVLRATMQAGAR